MIEKWSHCYLSNDLLLVIMEYLDAKDLCRCSQVSWSWYCINKSLENTTWKRLFLRDFSGILNFKSANMYFHKFSEIKNDLINENFLMNTFTRHSDEKTWKELYRNHFIWKNLWKLRSEEVLAKSCGCIIRPLMDKSELHVGPVGFHYSSVRDAMASIHPYCTLIVHPGNYDEQIKISIIMPLQIIGPGSISPITIYFDCDTSAVRMCNVVLKSPWFSEILLRVRSGFVQLESCDLMNGEVHVTSPGVLAMRYCNIDNAKISFIKSCCSIIEHCEFKNNIDFNDFIHVEGAPKYERITVCSYLLNQIKKSLPQFDSNNFEKINFTKNEYTFQIPRKTKSCDSLEFSNRKVSLNSLKSSKIQRKCLHSFQFDTNKFKKIHTQVNLSLLKDQRIMHLLPFFDNFNELNSDNVSKHSISGSFDNLQLQGQKFSSKQITTKSIDRRNYSKFIRKCCNKQEIKRILDNINGPLLLNCNFSNSKFVINCMLEANIIIINCEMNSCGDIIRLSRFSKAFIYHNRMHHSTGSAICLKHGSEAVIIGNEIYAIEEGAIEIRKNTSPYIYANKIHSNGKCGISFVSNNGQVEFNDICFNKLGISILHSANPIIRSNTIRSNKSFGIIINERSISVVDDNLIFKNHESNICIRKFSSPVITCNFIYQADNNGIYLEDGSKGTIANNIIMGNSKSGILLLNADFPYIYGNQICQNKQHGIHISRATMENDDNISDDQDNELENNSMASYCDTTYSSEFDDYEYSKNNDLTDVDNDINKINSDECWIRRKHSLIHIEFNSIYCNSGCGISNDTNIATEILSNAIHANLETGISLIVPGVFGLTYGSPKLSLHPNLETSKKSNLQPLNSINTFLLEDNVDEPKISVLSQKVTPYLGDNHLQWKMRHRTLGQILKNSITDNGNNGITINTTHFSAARFVIVGNGIYDNHGNGLSIQTECEIINNDILGNSKAAIQAKSRAWIYLIMNRLLSVKTATIDVYEPSITLACKSNILYTTSLQSEVISVILDTARTTWNKDKFSVKCLSAFRSANTIEYFPDGMTDSSYSNQIRSSFSNRKSLVGLHNYPLRPIIIKDTHHVRVSIALSDAMNSFNRSSRSEICLLL